MKKLVKLTLTALVAATMMIMLVACGGGAASELDGKWELEAMEMLGEEISISDFAANGFIGTTNMVLEFTSAKAYKTSGKFLDEDMTSKGSYEYASNKGTMDPKDDPVDFSLEGGRLYLDFDDFYLIFTK